MKRTKIILLVGGMFALGACTEPMNGTGDTVDGQIRPVPEQVRVLAAPNQDVDSARLTEDGCYWYSYRGPVETTLLPLRARDGGQICGGGPATT